MCTNPRPEVAPNAALRCGDRLVGWWTDLQVQRPPGGRTVKGISSNAGLVNVTIETLMPPCAFRLSLLRGMTASCTVEAEGQRKKVAVSLTGGKTHVVANDELQTSSLTKLVKDAKEEEAHKTESGDQEGVR